MLLNDIGFSILKLENERMVLGLKTNEFKSLKILYQPISDITFRLTGLCMGRGLLIMAKRSDSAKEKIK